MALARSASGPGGLSINTNSANSLFGSGTTPASGGMFGNTGASKPGGLFGSSTATTTAPQTAGLFGSTAAQPQTGGLSGSNPPASQAQTGGLFGSTAASTQPQTGGLFGATHPQQSGGLFGNTSTTQPAQTTGLFGASTTASQPQQAGGLFGAAPAQSAQGASGGGLFSGLNNQNQAKPATSLFGSGLGSTTQNQQQPQHQQQSSSMFPTLNQNQGGGLFGSTLGGGPSLGQSTNQQQQTIPGVRIDVSQLRGTTRFNDLHDDIQKQVKLFDDVIQGQMRLKDDCEAIMPAHSNQLNQIPNDVEFCRRKRIGVENAQDSDAQAISIVQKLIKVDAEHAKLSFKAVNNLKLPTQYHNAGPWSGNPSANEGRGQENGDSNAQDIVSFFNQTADELAATLNTYQKHIVEIEQHLRSVEANSAQQINALVAKRNGTSTGQEDARSELIAVLNDFEQGMIAVASKVGGSREGLQSLQLDGFGASQNGQRNGRRNGLY
ncbi:related to NUP49 Nuclear pore protein [Rhynchosporium graminicola]|uniref:Related to NUP49 Nuclear pore protein n=1 Tax=Rhynchosporium graminicola TaxID=2792576 RepID=A0A1E1JSW3_9HELO|nr:related to NUP49 Nuclear pore protein [Rhynchosporium commune]